MDYLFHLDNNPTFESIVWVTVIALILVALTSFQLKVCVYGFFFSFVYLLGAISHYIYMHVVQTRVGSKKELLENLLISPPCSMHAVN